MDDFDFDYGYDDNDLQWRSDEDAWQDAQADAWDGEDWDDEPLDDEEVPDSDW